MRIEDAVSGQQSDVADRAWRTKSRDRFVEIRAALDAMCSGIERCMYCEDSAWTDIDHFVPKSEAPHLAFTWTNYLAACSACNSNYKRAEFPRAAGGARLLIDPTQDDPPEHLMFSPATGMYSPCPGSALALDSIRVFDLNRAGLTKGRQDAWHLLQLAIVAYAQARRNGDHDRAERYQAIAARQPFAGVLKALVTVSDMEHAVGVTADCMTAIERHPEVREWPEVLFAGA